MEALGPILAFVEGRVPLRAFVATVEQDRDLQAVLEADVRIPPYTNGGTLLYYILVQDAASLAAEVSIRDALSRLLDARGVTHAADTMAAARYDLLLAQTPKWLVIPDRHVGAILDAAEDAPDRASAAKAIRATIMASFRCLTKPPRWLQSPEWMFVEDRPLTFVGQMDLGTLMHDEARLYIFHDGERGAFHTLTQTA